MKNGGVGSLLQVHMGYIDLRAGGMLFGFEITRARFHAPLQHVASIGGIQWLSLQLFLTPGRGQLVNFPTPRFILVTNIQATLASDCGIASYIIPSRNSTVAVLSPVILT